MPIQLPHVSALSTEHVVRAFNKQFLAAENTLLCGGADEPYYIPPIDQRPASIWFRSDYVRSALHEVAHWCVAGRVRRQQEDYGYWYTPDDRNGVQQAAFFAVEARPQAIERRFCDALDLPFQPSVDNLSLVIDPDALQLFADRLEQYYQQYARQGLPRRATLFFDALKVLLVSSERNVT